jgi:hypothetical protein
MTNIIAKAEAAIGSDIISDDEVVRVHGYANFGSMTPREVVNDGVRKYAVGYTGGSTQVAILREHGLITQTKGAGYRANLTEKGKRYARAIYDHARAQEAMIARLRDALEAMRRQFSPFPSEDTERWREEHEACEQADAILAKLKGANP